MSDNKNESFDDGIPAFLKIPQKERNEAAAKLKEKRAAEARAIAVRPDLATPPESAIVVSNATAAKVEAAPAPVKAAPKKTAKPAKATKKAAPKKAAPEPVEENKATTETVQADITPITEGRLVAKPNTKHSARKLSGQSQFPKIAALIKGKWVSRDVICKTLDIVDNTCRCYLGQMAHVPEYATMRYRAALTKKGPAEYILPLH